MVFDAPGYDGLSNWIINAARRKYPGKPFSYVVLTHHHLDHTGGIRAYAAQAAAIGVGKGDGDYFRKVVTAPQTLNRYGVKTMTPRVIHKRRPNRRSAAQRLLVARRIATPVDLLPRDQPDLSLALAQSAFESIRLSESPAGRL